MYAQHTPAPWKFAHGSTQLIVGPDGHDVAYIDTAILERSIDAQVANGLTLMAAADMKEVLEGIAMDVDFDGLKLDPRRLAKLRAALAKANGDTSLTTNRKRTSSVDL